MISYNDNSSNHDLCYFIVVVKMSSVTSHHWALSLSLYIYISGARTRLKKVMPRWRKSTPSASPFLLFYQRGQHKFTRSVPRFRAFTANERILWIYELVTWLAISSVRKKLDGAAENGMETVYHLHRFWTSISAILASLFSLAERLKYSRCILSSLLVQ